MVLGAAWLRGASGLVLAVLVTVAAILVWRVGDGAHGYLRDAAASAFVLCTCPLSPRSQCCWYTRATAPRG